MLPGLPTLELGAHHLIISSSHHLIISSQLAVMQR
jgi:hypothetical protein